MKSKNNPLLRKSAVYILNITLIHRFPNLISKALKVKKKNKRVLVHRQKIVMMIRIVRLLKGSEGQTRTIY